MLKFLLAAAPYLLKAPSQTSQKQIARSFSALVLFAFSGMAFSAAVFIYLTYLYGSAIGFLSIGVLFLFAGLLLSYKARHPKKLTVSQTAAVNENDPIAALVPDALLKDPTIAKVINQISAKPVAASLVAAAIGMLITREIMKD